MPVEFYRYLSHLQEINQVTDERKVQSTNPRTGHATWYTPTRYDTGATAQEELSLPNPPTHRIGPMTSDQMPVFDIGLRPVAPAFGHPGGGVEARTKFPVWLLGFWEFQTRAWVF